MATSPVPEHPLARDPLLEALVSDLPDAVIVTDLDRRVVLANRAAERLFGHAPEELLGRSMQILYADEAEYRRVGELRWRSCPSRPREAYEARYRRRDGETFSGEAVSAMLRGADGAVLGCLAAVRDVAVHREGLESLVRTSTRLEDALEALDEGFSLWDAQDRLLLSNTRYHELYPVSAGLVLPGVGFEALIRYGIAHGEFEVPPEEREDWVRERLRRHRQPPEAAFEQQHADGHWILVKERATRDGGIAGIRVDITAQKRTELALRELAAIGSSPGVELEERFSRLLALGCGHFGLPGAAIVVREGGELRVRNVHGGGAALAPGTSFEPAGTLSARVLEDGLLALVGEGAPSGPAQPLTRSYSVRACLAEAFGTGEGRSGLIAFFGDTPRSEGLADGERVLLRLLAQFAGHELARNETMLALDQARRDLERLATTDELTGLLNRRAILELGRAEFERARRYRHELCVLALDLDFFKNVNDTLGHAAGDRVLQAVAECCRRGVRNVDSIGRLGGEEFVVLLIQAGQAQGMEVGERIRLAVAAVDAGAQISVSVSVGVAERRDGDPDFEGLLARADAALYWAKERGRNRVCLAPG